MADAVADVDCFRRMLSAERICLSTSRKRKLPTSPTIALRFCRNAFRKIQYSRQKDFVIIYLKKRGIDYANNDENEIIGERDVNHLSRPL